MEGNAAVGDALNKLRDGFHVIRFSVIKVDQGREIRKLIALHGSLVTAQLFGSAVGIGIIEIQYIVDSGTDQARGGLEHGRVIIA